MKDVHALSLTLPLCSFGTICLWRARATCPQGKDQMWFALLLRWADLGEETSLPPGDPVILQMALTKSDYFVSLSAWSYVSLTV